MLAKRLLAKRLNEEFGYSLVEVMVSIVLLTIAILPMVGMFDMGIKSTASSSNYDKSRALANLKLEEAKSLTFADAENNFPEAATPDPNLYSGSGNYLSDWMTDEGEPYWDNNYANFEYRVEKQYMQMPTEDSVEWVEDTSGTPTNLIRITVTVQWANGNEYSTTGLVSS